MLRGYDVGSGFVGFLDTLKMLFPTEDEYIEYMKEKEEEDGRREEERLKDRRKAHA